jgi:L-ascorbate metabolism protein UlaG (beta-lactamase superfamily)
MKIVLVAMLFAAAIAAPAQVQTLSTSAGEVKITPLYHASALIQAGGKSIYIDPAKPAKLSGLPKADLILVTHLHQDHFDPDSIAQLSRTGTEVIAPPTVAEQLSAAQAITNGQTRQWSGWSIEAVPAYNLKRGPSAGEFYHPRGRDNGYVLSYGGKRIYFSADTEGTPEMRALKNIDLAFVCMNLPWTMPPEEAAEAVRAFHPKVAIPYHYRGSELSVFQKRLVGSGVEVRLLEWYPK